MSLSRRLVALLAVLAMTFATVVASVVAAPRAAAADLSGSLTNQNVSVSSTTVTGGQFIQAQISFCLPADGAAGDTVTIDLPSQIERWTRTFSVNGGGALVDTVFGSGVVDNTKTPPQATITLSNTYADIAASKPCVTLSLSGLVKQVAEEKKDELLSFKIGGQSPVTVPVVIKPSPEPGTPGSIPTTPTKQGRFTANGDRCQQADSAVGCLVWDMRAPVSATIDDPANPGQKVTKVGDVITFTDAAKSSAWTWWCAADDGTATSNRLVIEDYTTGQTGEVGGTGGNIVYLGADGVIDGAASATYGSAVQSVSCTPNLLTVSIDTRNLPHRESMVLRLTWRATPKVVTTDATIYDNDLDVSYDGTRTSVRSEFSNTKIGGQMVGDGIKVDKHDRDGNAGDDPGNPVELGDGIVPMMMLAPADLLPPLPGLPGAGETRIVFQVSNLGTNTLRNFTVTDTKLQGSGEVTDMFCDFSAYGGSDHADAVRQADGSLVVTSLTSDEQAAVAAGKDPASKDFVVALPAGEFFSCYATLRGVTQEVHGDNVTVTAYGEGKVSGENPYYAFYKSFAVSKTTADQDLVLSSLDEQQIDRTYTVTVVNNGKVMGTSQAVYDRPETPEGFTVAKVTIDGLESALTPYTAPDGKASEGYMVTMGDLLDTGASMQHKVVVTYTVTPSKITEAGWTALGQCTSENGGATSQPGQGVYNVVHMAGDSDVELLANNDACTNVSRPVPPSPAIDIEKIDVNGQDADTAAETVDLTGTNGAIGLSVPVTNTGNVDLTNLVISDSLLGGSGNVTELTCDFSQLSDGKVGVLTDDLSDGAVSISAGKDVILPVGKTVTCTAKLSGVSAEVHSDRMTVTADGVVTSTDKDGKKVTTYVPVTDKDDYFAKTILPTAPAVPTKPAKTPKSAKPSSSLARTGADSLAAVILSAGAMTAGGLLLAGRRRKES